MCHTKQTTNTPPLQHALFIDATSRISLCSMRRSRKMLVRIISVVAVACLIVVGTSAYNFYHYRRPGDNPRDPATITAKGDVEPVSGDYLRGFYYPAHGDTHPGTVVVFSGSDGGNNDNMARQIRDGGYNVLGLYFFGQPGQQQYLSDVPLEFFDEVLAWIKEHGDVQAPITVLGLSKGAELVANLAIRYPEINNIVLYAPAAYNYQGLNFRQRNALPSFTWRREPVDYARLPFFPSTTVRLFMNLPVSYRKTYEVSLAEASNRDSARIPIEKFSGHGLLFAGNQDAMWQSDSAVQELSERNKNLEGVIYPGAGHLFSRDIDQEYGRIWPTMLGGTVDGNRAAKIQSDKLLFERLDAWHMDT